ncbi:unnamed protein product [Anisakis simplex]|uniref:Enoyl-[acyl-carrier-protein] reductase, mitochondrial n=1 Tax=Anisakis simplex TaxID=6269 RepID=A0A0M3JF37_ANISI|nr:unnamed protein product [Anisakis simplex]
MSVNKVLQYLKFGDPTKVLQLAANAMPNAPGAGQVIVKWIAAPINPLDLNKISGTYPAHKAKFPCIGGSEGVGLIEAVGSGVKGLSKGDKVIPTLLDKPTWANYALWDANNVRKVDDRMSIVSDLTI